MERLYSINTNSCTFAHFSPKWHILSPFAPELFIHWAIYFHIPSVSITPTTNCTAKPIYNRYTIDNLHEIWLNTVNITLQCLLGLQNRNIPAAKTERG